MKLNIRKANNQDAEQISKLLKQLGYGLSTEEVKSRIDQCSSTGIYNFLVVEYEQLVVSLCIYVIYPVFYKLSNRCFLEILVTLEKYRNHGIASKLLDYLEIEAKASKCTSVYLLSNKNRESSTANFYRNKGYANDGLQAQLFLRKEI